MENPTTSSIGIRFLSPAVLTEAIVKIETSLPGWWWSLSQQHKTITFSAGPGQNCPDPREVLFSRTRAGDRGFVNNLNYLKYIPGADFLVWIDDMLLFIKSNVLEYTNTLDKLFDNVQSDKVWYRNQPKDALFDLKNAYATFLEKLDIFEKKGHILKEVYLGSCDLSTDCSLRGTREDGTEFDISIDLRGGDVTIADSLKDCVTELINDILTFLSEKKGIDACSVLEQTQS